jgi:hypothetical protein
LASSRWPIGKKILHHHYYYYYTLVLCQTYSYVRVSGEMVVAFGMMIHRLLDSILFPSHWTRSVPNRVGIMNNKYVYERVKRRWHTRTIICIGVNELPIGKDGEWRRSVGTKLLSVCWPLRRAEGWAAY